MLASADIDIVDICTGPESHLEYVKKASAAGKHILCQKPFAQTYDEAVEMVEIAEKNGVRMMVTENWRWLMPFRTIKNVIDSGKLGKIRVARYIHSDWYSPRMNYDAIIPQPFFREMPHLLFYEMGAHWYDTWRSLFGTPDRLYAEISSISPFITGEDSGIITLGYKDWYGFMDMSWATRQKLENPPKVPIGPEHLEQMIIDGDLGTLKLFTDGKITLVSKNGDTESVIEEKTWLDHQNSHILLSAHFIDCLEKEEPFVTSGRDNLDTMKMVFATYQSAKSHEVVILT